MSAKKVSIKLDKTRYLRYDFDALCELEQLYDKSFIEIMTDVFGFSEIPAEEDADKEGLEKKILTRARSIKLSLIRDFLWAGLLDDDPDLTPKQVSKMIKMPNLPEITAKLLEAVSIAFPKEAGEKKA